MFASAPAKRAAQRLANSGGDALHGRITENTPVRTGNLRTSWYRTPAVPVGKRYSTHVATEVDYAPYVNYGTGLKNPEHPRKYLIEPVRAKMLHWIDPKSGEDRYAHRVWHPGSEGAFMIESGAAKTEAELARTVAADLDLFKREMEAQALKAQENAR